MSNFNDDDFIAGMIAAGILVLAGYGAYKLVKEVSKSREQRLFEILGEDLVHINSGYNNGGYLLPEAEEDDSEDY